jgi:nitrogenase subunit NifH
MAMDNNPSSKRADVVFFALRLSYRLSDLIVRMGDKILEQQCSDKRDIMISSFRGKNLKTVMKLMYISP